MREKVVKGLAVAVAGCCALLAVWYGALNQDEGWYLYAAQMVRDGQLPYRDFFFTQGPALPFVYALFTWVWAQGSALCGLLGARVVTGLLGLSATGAAAGLARALVPAEKRRAAGWCVFALLACNLYHVYFTTIPKTYALGSLFVLGGFWLLAKGLEKTSGCRTALAGFLMALASGTRISLILILPVVGLGLLARWRTDRRSWLWFGAGGALGLFLTYGLFALDPVSRAALLAAQEYHAARGGFDLFFALGSVSRLARGYAALGVTLFAVCALAGRARARVVGGGVPLMMLVSFLAVFALQLSAPFPYDDYQVPIMGLLTVVIVTAYCRLGGDWRFVVLTACLVSFTSPQVQEWMTYAPDRFWSRKKEMSELAKLRLAAQEVEAIDPGGKTLLTQDLYLAVECGRRVPAGLEMGPFSYFPDLPDDAAAARHVLNRAGMERLLQEAPCPVAACSGYAFAIAAPSCRETDFAEQTRLHDLLKKNYALETREENFGQNATTLLLLRRKDAQ